jgi:protein-disulfide isomerase
MAHRSGALVLFLAGAAIAQTAGKSALDKPTLEAYLRHLNMWNPQVAVEISDPKPSKLDGLLDVRVRASLGARSIESDYMVTKDGRKIVQANVYEIDKSPFQEDVAKLKLDGAPSQGKPNSLLTVAVFSDFQCTYCQALAKTLRENLLKTYPDKVQLVFKDMPLDSLHPWARSAAAAGRCVYQSSAEKFWAYHDWIFDKQGEITAENLKAKVVEWAGQNGIDGLRLGACMERPETLALVEKSAAEGRALRVGSTPTMFINGRRVPGSVPWPDLKNLLDLELAHAEACCSIELSPAKPAAGTKGSQ